MGLRVAIIASSRFPVAEPFAGGLEAHVWLMVRALKRRGHQVSLFAAPGSDSDLEVEELPLRTIQLSASARRDVSMSADLSIDEHHAYLTLMMQLGRGDFGAFDIVHNHSLHYLPVAMAPMLSIPMVSTLHTPPTPWLESAIQTAESSSVRFVSVSAHTARAWQHVCSDTRVISNGIDCSRWVFGTGGGPLVWTGRIVPEKAPHLAAQAAKLAGRPLVLAGPIIDRAYFAAEVAPFLSDDIRYLGHLDQTALSAVVRSARAALVTPGWDEPYGLVVAEALASGTPVAAFARGGIPEILDETCGRLVTPGDASALARVIPEVEGLSRHAARHRAITHCSSEVMVSHYEDLYADMLAAA